MACRINNGRKWSSRIIMEYLTHGQLSWFITLTYSDENLPTASDIDGAPVATLRKNTFLKWLNNQMSDLGSFRYYAVGEYGDIYGRPHYHLAVFPQTFEQANALCDNWQRRFGFASIAEINESRARYLAAYTTKKLTAPDDERLKGCQEPEFRSSSRRPPLGSAFIEKTIHHYKTSAAAKALIADRGDVERTFRFGGHVYPLGRWPLQKIREGLGIPLRHSDRMEHPNYAKYHEVREAECEPQMCQAQRNQLNAKKKRQLYRSQSIKL